MSGRRTENAIHKANAINKVYVNPNFQQSRKAPVVHLNPAFSTNSKIFVNPNFVSQTNLNRNLFGDPSHIIPGHTNHTVPPTNYQSPQEPCCSKYLGLNQPQIVSKSRFSITKSSGNKSNSTENYNSDGIRSVTVVKSKYSLKRSIKDNSLEHRNNLESMTINEAKKTVPLMLPSSKTRFKIVRMQRPVLSDGKLIKNKFMSRYRTMSLTNAKPLNKTSVRRSLTSNKSLAAVNNKYKIIKKASFLLKLNKKAESWKRINITTSTNDNLRTSVLPVKQRLKKNNIPCPLFAKYGVCLRKDRGSCSYLHDKKHVKLCRKFLMGLCFNNNCQLSHENTTKKLPTCHFYLKGACAKENCPYLHVKLDDDAKICKEFMKGYCEKGENCLYRHSNSNTQHNSTMKWTSKNKKKNPKLPSKQCNTPVAVTETTSSTEQFVDKDRYYKDTTESGSSDSQQIKPSRCKLGSLPSFIKL